MVRSAVKNGAQRSVSLRHWLEASALRVLVALVGALPREVARSVGAGIGGIAWGTLGRLRAVGLRNLQLAFPEKSERERRDILRGEYRSLGWQIAEFCKMRNYTAAGASDFIRYDGLDHYLAARDEGKGVLVLTGHWVHGSFPATITH